jgi:hypothetical protein
MPVRTVQPWGLAGTTSHPAVDVFVVPVVSVVVPAAVVGVDVTNAVESVSKGFGM